VRGLAISLAVLAGFLAVAAQASPRAGDALRGKVVVIDPGHNPGNFSHPDEINRQVNAGTLWKACDTTGTATPGGYTEASYTFDVSVRVTRILERDGIRVYLTRTATGPAWGPCITERAAIGNRHRANAAISIHADGGPSSGRGFHVIQPAFARGYTDDIYGASRRLALDVRDGYASGSGMPYATYIGSRGIDERSDLGGLNLSNVPKVFIETGNMQNSTDASLLRSAAWRQRAAAAIARGLERYLRR
jgi:N-acetylmuramoyl-L-alanine amidase